MTLWRRATPKQSGDTPNDPEDKPGNLISLRSLVIIGLAAGCGYVVHVAHGTVEATIGTVVGVAVALHSLVGR